MRYFKILYRFRGPGLRFNGRALIEGAKVAFGKIDSFTSDIVETIHDTANRHAITIKPGLGDVLIADNWRSLHDRLELSVPEGPSARVSYLCFVNDYKGKPYGLTVTFAVGHGMLVGELGLRWINLSDDFRNGLGY